MSEHRPSAGPRKPVSPEPRRPYHIGVLIGLSTGAYALSLAAVTTLQVASDQALIDERAPMRMAIDLLADHHDRMAAGMDAARRGYDAASGGYESLSDRIEAVHDGLGRLNRTVTRIEGSADQLPGSLNLPPVPQLRPQRAAPRPAQAPAAAPPSTHGSTGASGKQ